MLYNARVETLKEAQQAKPRTFFLAPESDLVRDPRDWDGEERWQITVYIGSDEGIRQMRRLIAAWTEALDDGVGSGESLELMISGVGGVTECSDGYSE